MLDDLNAATPAKLRSRLAQRLDADIAAAAGLPPKLATLQVQRAILWLRHGRDADARAELDRLHRCALDHPGAELAAWLHLAEGLITYFGAFGGGAHERVRRASVMASAVGATRLAAMAEAWLGQIAFVGRDIHALIRHAGQALQSSAGREHDVAFRVGNVLALAWGFASEGEEAAGWYAWARQQAVADGDDAGLAAVLYNQTQTRAQRIRHASLAGKPGEAPGVLLGIASIGHYDDAVGGSAREDLTPLLRAQLLTVQGDHAAAAELLQAQLPAAIAAGLNRVGGSLLADLAWCWVNLGDTARARMLAEQAAVEVLAEDPTCCDVDEQVALHARLAQVYERLGQRAQAEREAAAADRAREADAAQRRDWLRALVDAGLQAPPR